MLIEKYNDKNIYLVKDEAAFLLLFIQVWGIRVVINKVNRKMLFL